MGDFFKCRLDINEHSTVRAKMQEKSAAGGGRTRTLFYQNRILSPARLPVPPPRHKLIQNHQPHPFLR